MGSISVGPLLDDEELQDELEALQQQELEDKMLETGAVPVDNIQQRLPNVANGESKSAPYHWIRPANPPNCPTRDCANHPMCFSQGQDTGRSRRRRGGAQAAAGRDGHVSGRAWEQYRVCFFSRHLARRNKAPCFPRFVISPEW